MGYPKLQDNVGLAAAIEATAGTAETITLANHSIRTIGASEPEFFYLAPNEATDFVTGDFDNPTGALPAGLCGRFRVRFAPRGAGAAYAYVSEASKTVPECHPLLRAAGMALTVSGGAGSEIATYAVATDPSTTITTQLEISNKKYTLKGAVVESLTLSCDSAGFPVADATIVGVLVLGGEQALEAHTYSSVTVPIWKGTSALAIGAVAPTGSRITTDWGLSAEPCVNVNAADGVDFYKITGRRVVTTVNARVPAIATWEPTADWAAKTARALAVRFGLAGGSGQYKRLNIAASATTYEDVQEAANGRFRDYVVKLHHGYHASATCNLVFD